MIGFTSVTFRKKSVDEIIILAGIAGAECVEWGTDVHVGDVRTAKQVAVKCSDAGISINSLGSYYKAGVSAPDSFESSCEIASELGAKVVRIWAGNTGSLFTTEEGLKRLVADTRRIEAVAQSYSITPAFEFHPNTFFDKGSTALSFLKNSTNGIAKSYWQPAYRGADMKNLNAILPAVANIHMFYREKLGKERCLLAKGAERLQEFAAVINESSFKGDILLEFVKDDSSENFIADMKQLKEIFNV